MTAPQAGPDVAEESLLARLLRPRVVLPALALLLVATVIFAPTVTDTRDSLTSYSTSPGGARGFHDFARALGWRVARREVRLATRMAPLDTAATYAVLAPGIEVTVEETHALLDAVRRGAGLLVVPQRGTPIADSLGIAPSSFGATQLLSSADSARACTETQNRRGLIDWPSGHVESWWLVPRRELPADTVVFARLHATARTRRAVADAGVDTLKGTLGAAGREGRLVAAVGYALGRGRVVVVADPDWLRNDVLRVCEWNASAQAARMLDYLAAGRTAGTRTLVFDEFHHGYGQHGSTLGVIRSALTETAWGRALLQAIVAALVLLAAVGARPLPPVARTRFERRSPLEHVGALAHAYGQIGATRTAARRLVRGLRRRHTIATVATARVGGAAASRSAAGGASDDELFLDAVATRHPEIASHAALLRAALATESVTTPGATSHRRGDDEAMRLGAAVAAIDEAMRGA